VEKLTENTLYSHASLQPLQLLLALLPIYVSLGSSALIARTDPPPSSTNATMRWLAPLASHISSYTATEDYMATPTASGEAISTACVLSPNQSVVLLSVLAPNLTMFKSTASNVHCITEYEPGAFTSKYDDK
jgi:hypothetical protein